MTYKFKPFSVNVIFLDTEFSTSDPYRGEILSIALIKLNGEELYLELEHKGYAEPWVKENILPTLREKKVSREEAVGKIRKFVGRDKPYLIAHVSAFDYVYMHKLFKSKSIKDLPFYWLPIDFPSILFGMGIDPYSLRENKNFLKEAGVDVNRFKHTHNALDDARFLREVYLRMTKPE